jgi:hypothetical protein
MQKIGAFNGAPDFHPASKLGVENFRVLFLIGTGGPSLPDAIDST